MGEHRRNPKAIAKVRSGIAMKRKPRDQRYPKIVDVYSYKHLFPTSAPGRAERRRHVRTMMTRARALAVSREIVKNRNAARDERRARKAARWWRVPA